IAVKRDIHRRSTPHFFGTQDAKPIPQCEIPIKIGADRLRNWNSDDVGFPLEWMAIKMKYDSSRRAMNHPCVLDWKRRWFSIGMDGHKNEV
ncbi:hypothetical protein AVEN_203078-1, partial [Araneus ventricosus]